MSTFKPSKYQRVVYTYIQKGKGNAVIDAVAGSGKSTTIVNALKLIPSNKSVLFLAFNKSIVEELKIKVGNLPNVDIRTIHSLGASAVMKTFHSKIDSDKYFTWLNNGMKYSLLAPTSELPIEQLADWKSNIRKLVDLARVNLVKSVAELDKLAFKHDLLLIDNEAEITLKAIKWGESETEIIDFTDMIYFPNVKQLRLWKYDWIFVDECQDLNAAQRELVLKHLKPSGRFVAVGDPRQAIYGFAGADVESFNILRKLPNTVKLPLSVCYRCDSSIIELAKGIVPQIEARPNAALGEVNRDCKIADIKDGDMVLCRVTTPLISLCMKYISEGIKAYVKGKDVGANLIGMIKKTNRKEIADVIQRLEEELTKLAVKIANRLSCSVTEAQETDMFLSQEDKVKAIEVLSQGLTKSSEVMDRIELIFSDDSKSGICLSTIHKSKGLESDRVFIIREDKMLLKSCMKVSWMAEQEHNLVYVAYTRAKRFLGFVTDF